MRGRLAIGAAVALGVGVLAGCGPRQPWQSTLVSRNAAGTDAANGASVGVAFSPDGRHVAFQSGADDLGVTDTNREDDVYLRDLTTGAVTLLSANVAGTDAGAGGSFTPAFSPDGSMVTFLSEAPDLVTSGTRGGIQQLYVRDLTTGVTTMVSANASGTGGGNEPSFEAAFSPDGTKVAFTSTANDLVPGTGADNENVFVRDLGSRVTQLVSRHHDGTAGGDGFSFAVSFARGGRAVVYQSTSDDLVPTDTNADDDVFVTDLASGTTSLLSTNTAGTDSGSGPSTDPAVSPDGGAVAFTSYAPDLRAGDTNELPDVYLQDLSTGARTVVSTDADGTHAPGGHNPEFNPDGTRIAFLSSVPVGDGIWVRDLAAGTIELVSVNRDGTGTGNATAKNLAFSPDGTRIAFDSRASDLGPNDAHDGDDVYVRDLVTKTTTLVSADTTGTDSGNGDSTAPVFSPDGRRVAFQTTASDLGAHDTNDTSDVYLATFFGADLGVALHATPEPVAAGGQLTYRLDVINGGPDAGRSVIAALQLPDGVAFAGAITTAGSCDTPAPGAPRLVVCHLGDLAKDASAQVVVTSTVPASASAGSTLTGLAVVDSPTVDPVARNVATADSTVGP